MKEIKVMLDKEAILPSRAHNSDAGLDLYSPKDFVLPPRKINRITLTVTEGSAIVDTGVHIEIPDGYVGFLKSKSGLNVKEGVTSEGVIDAGYTGSVVVKLYNHSGEPVKFTQGQKISQLVILPVATPKVIQVTRLDETERGDNGFGSTGK